MYEEKTGKYKIEIRVKATRNNSAIMRDIDKGGGNTCTLLISKHKF